MALQRSEVFFLEIGHTGYLKNKKFYAEFKNVLLHTLVKKCSQEGFYYKTTKIGTYPNMHL
jgi:hypothetical protein